jgi:hypothetical protein
MKSCSSSTQCNQLVGISLQSQYATYTFNSTQSFMIIDRVLHPYACTMYISLCVRHKKWDPEVVRTFQKIEGTFD